MSDWELIGAVAWAYKIVAVAEKYGVDPEQLRAHAQRCHTHQRPETASLEHAAQCLIDGQHDGRRCDRPAPPAGSN